MIRYYQVVKPDGASYRKRFATKAEARQWAKQKPYMGLELVTVNGRKITRWGIDETSEEKI